MLARRPIPGGESFRGPAPEGANHRILPEGAFDGAKGSFAGRSPKIHPDVSVARDEIGSNQPAAGRSTHRALLVGEFGRNDAAGALAAPDPLAPVRLNFVPALNRHGRPHLLPRAFETRAILR